MQTSSDLPELAPLALRAKAELERRKRAKAAALGLDRADVDGTDADLLDAFARRYRSDYLGFCDLLEIDGRRGREPFRLNNIQRAYHEARTQRDVCLKARRVGMTTEALARDLWHFLTQDGAHVGIVCQSGKNSQGATMVRRIFDQLVDSLRRRGLPLKFEPNKMLELALPSRGSTLDIIEAGESEGAAQKSGRGMALTRLHCTEMASWSFGGQTMMALRYCVAGIEFGTEVQYESTANGSAGDDRADSRDATGAAIFYWACQDAERGDNGFRLHFFPWFQDADNRRQLLDGERIEPRTDRERQLVSSVGIDGEQLKWYQAQLAEVGSQNQIDQELASDSITCFLVAGNPFFDANVTGQLLSVAYEPKTFQHIKESGARGQYVGATQVPAIRLWHAPKPGRPYVIAVDSSAGSDKDASAAVVLERGTGLHMATLWGQFKPWELGLHLIPFATSFNHAEIAVERIGYGGTVLQALEVRGYRNVFRDHDAEPGWLNTEPSREQALSRLEQAHRSGHFKSFDRFLLGEMRTFIFNKVGRRFKPEGARGTHDDLVMATAIGWDVICRPMRTGSSMGGLPLA